MGSKRSTAFRALILACVLALVPVAKLVGGAGDRPPERARRRGGHRLADLVTINVTDLSVPIQAHDLDDDEREPEPVPDRTRLDHRRSPRPAAAPSPKTPHLRRPPSRHLQVRVKATTGASDYTLQRHLRADQRRLAAIASYSKTYGFADTQSMFPYGTAFDPTDNTVLVGDYWNFRIQRYSSTGRTWPPTRTPCRRGRGRALRRRGRPERHARPAAAAARRPTAPTTGWPTRSRPTSSSSTTPATCCARSVADGTGTALTPRAAAAAT